MRGEHWYDFGTQAGDANMFSLVMAHIATATIPDAVLQYLRAGQVTPLAKPTGGTQTTQNDVVPSSTGAQSGYSSQTIVSHRGGGCAPTRSGMEGWMGPTR